MNSPYSQGGFVSGPGWPGTGQPLGGNPAFSIQLVIEGGVNPELDNMHALYKPGSRLHMSSVVRDMSGRVVNGNDCTFQPTIADNTGPNGASRAHLVNDAQGWWVVFDHEPGVFTLGAQCQGKPGITSQGHMDAPLNFETARCNNRFAHTTLAPDAPCSNDTPKDAPKGHHMGAGTILGIVGASLAGAYLAYVLAGGTGVGSPSQYCFDITQSSIGSCSTGHYCEPTQSACENDFQQVQAICVCHLCTGSVTYGPNPCSASARRGPVRDVHDLVERGLAMQRTQGRLDAARTPPRGAASTAMRPARPIAASGGAPSTSNPQVWLDAALAAATIATTTWAVWRATRPDRPSVEMIPWATPQGGGLSVSGRF